MKELKKQHLEMLQLLESIEVMLQNSDSIHPDSVIRGAIQTAIGMDINLNNKKMEKEEIKNDISVKSRLAGMTNEQLKVIDFIIDSSFKDNQEVYTNGAILVPLFRVLDAIAQGGKEYQESC